MTGRAVQQAATIGARFARELGRTEHGRLARARAVTMAAGPARAARVEDVHALAMAMPHVIVESGSQGNPVYLVGGKSFIVLRNPRPDAIDPATGERYPDVIVFWVASEADKLAVVSDEAAPLFTTSHFGLTYSAACPGC